MKIRPSIFVHSELRLNNLHTMIIRTLLSLSTLALGIATSISQNYTCPEHLYKTQVFSTDPLIIYIHSFLTPLESQHLQNISQATLTHSLIADQTGQERLANTRTSRSTSLVSDPVVRCIEARALQFQGYDIPRQNLEPLQAVHYSLGEQYKHHTDWFTSSSQTTSEFGGNRLSSFFVYVAASEDIIGGGTQFPLLDAPHDERWCEVVNCDAGWEEGVTFRPVARNAVFWRNLKEVKEGGKVMRIGDRRTLHAGLPVQRGVKLGMNIWTREAQLDGKYRSDAAME